MEFLKKKKCTLFSFVVSSVVALVSYVAFATKCFSVSCGSELRETIVPIFWFSTPLTILILCFLFFPEAIYRSWLKHIAWWYLLGLLITTLNTPVYSSNIFAVDRSQVVFGGVVLLAIITIPYIFWLRRRIKKSS